MKRCLVAFFVVLSVLGSFAQDVRTLAFPTAITTFFAALFLDQVFLSVVFFPEAFFNIAFK